MELGESEFMARQLARRNAWLLHVLVLLALATAYFILFGDDLGARGLSALGAFVLGAMLLVYAAITTLVVAFVGRRPAAPLVVHGLALAGFATWVVVMTDQRDADAQAAASAEALARANQRELPQSCVRVRGVEVSEGTPLRAVVRLASVCEDPVEVAQVTVAGEGPDGELLLTGIPGERTLPRSGNARVDVTASDGRGATNTAAWNWAVFVELDAPASANCYATPRSSRRDRCEMMGPVEPAPP